MSLPAGMDERRVIPLWLDPRSATAAGERSGTTSARQLSAREIHWLDKLSTEFLDQPSNQSAIEWLSTAEVLGVPNVAEDARRHLQRSGVTLWRVSPSASPNSNKSAADKEISSPPQIRARAAIASLKRRLTNPNQPHVWSELSRNYLQLGQKEKARRAMEAALLVAAPSRYLLRAATRLFVHLKDPERALSLLLQHPGLKEDPWLLAAEISTNSVIGKHSRFLRHSGQLAATLDVPATHLSELRAALATVEYEHGHLKHAKELFQRCSNGANGNVRAQLEWLNSIDPNFLLCVQVDRTQLSGEASAWHSRTERNWRGVVAGCDDWLSIEPFSSRPAMLASYTTHTALRDYQQSIAYCTFGLATNPRNFTLLNNRAVGYARLGDMQNAKADIQKALAAAMINDAPVLLATLGLLAMRGGYRSAGSELYERSLDSFYTLGSKSKGLVALLHLSEELSRYSMTEAKALFDRIKKLIATSRLVLAPEVVAYQQMLEFDFKRSEVGPTLPTRQCDGLDKILMEIGNTLLHRFPSLQNSSRRSSALIEQLIQRSYVP